MSSGLETQKVRLKVNIKKITMNIKFPCSLTVQVKHDNSTDSKKLHELKNGQCNLGESLESECQAVFNQSKMKYEDKKIFINIFMVSMSGKVASGSVSFSFFGKETGHTTECVQFLEKCPDKQAKIYYSFSIELLRKSQRLDKTFFSQFKEEQIRKKQGYNSVYIPGGLRTPKTQRGDNKQLWKVRRSPSPHHELNQSLVQGVTVFDKQAYKNEIKNQRMHTNLSMQEQGHLTITNRDRSKSKRMRENFSTRDMVAQNLTERFQTQIQEDEDKEEIQKLRTKIRNLERNDKGTVQTLRQTKEEGERRKNKINQLETAKFELEQALRNKEDKIKRLEKLWKDLSEQKEDGQNQYRSLKAQFDLRENITKDQIKKLEEKYRQSESEREKITEEYNRALKTFEEGQKKYQGLLKEKERAGFQEKGRINKKLEQQVIDYEMLEKEAKELKNQLQDLIRQKKQLYDDYTLSQANLSSTKNLVQSLNSKLRSEAQRIQRFQEEIEQFKVSEIEKQQIKKKLNELTINNGSLTENLQKKDKMIQTIELKIKELEQQCQKKNNEKNQLNLKYNQLKKNYDSSRMSQEQRIKENESLASMNESANNRIYDLKQKLQMEKRSLEDNHRDFTARYNAILRERDSLMTQNEEIRWEISKLGATTQELSLQIRSQNEEIFRLNQEILEKNQRIKKMDVNYKQIQTSHDHTTAENAELEKKKRQLTGYCKERDQENVELRKKLDRSERQNSDLKQRLKAADLSVKEKSSDFEKKLKDKEDANQAKMVQIQNLTTQLRDSNDENSLLKQAAMTSQQEISHLKDMITSNRRELDGQQNLILKLKESQNQNKKIIDEYEADLRKKKEQIEGLKKKAEKSSEEHNSFKNLCCTALQCFLNDLLKEEETPTIGNQVLKNRNGLYPDERIAALQIEYLQKHWQNGSKQRVKIAQLLQDKDVLEYQMNRLKINIDEVSKKSEFDIINERDKIKVLYAEISKKEEREREEIHKYEEILLQKQKEIEQYKGTILKLEEQAAELNSQIQVLIGQYDSLKEDNRQLEQKLLQARSQEIRDKADWQGKTKEAAQLFQGQISQLRLSQLQNEKKVASLEKELGQKIDLIKKYEMDQNVLAYQKDKKEIRVSELAMRVEEYQADGKEYQKQLRQKQRDLKKASEVIDQLGGKLREEKEKLEELMFKNQEQNHVIFQLNREIEKDKEELRLQQEKSGENDYQNRQKMEGQRTIIDKQTQEIKDLKENNISLKSQIELKKFMLAQLEQTTKIEKEVKEELKSELEKKKNLIYELTEETTTLKYQLRESEQQLTSTRGQKELLSVTIQRLQQNINQMRVNSREDPQSNEAVLRLQREIDKLKQEKSEQEQFYERAIQDLKSSLRESKKTEASRTWKEQQLRKKLKNTEKLLESSHPDLLLEKNRIFKEAEKDKRELYSRNQSLESRVDQLQDQVSSSRQRWRRETEKYTNEIESLKEEMNAKDFIIRNQQLQLQSIAYKVNDLTSEKSRLQNEVQREKDKAKKVQADLLNEQKSYKEKLKKIKEDEMRGVLGELERKLEASRNRRMEGNFNELERVIVSGSYREIEDIVRNVVKQKRY